MPENFSIKSTNEFLEIIRNQSPDKKMASLDVESLFTNVPVEETIAIILKYVYHNDDTEKPAPLIPENYMKSLLFLCTTECPFFAPDGTLY
jgi:L-lysine 2,3-aminomutase